jgi:hypothetical protein
VAQLKPMQGENLANEIALATNARKANVRVFILSTSYF